MAELPLRQTLEKIQAHPELADLLLAAHHLHDGVQTGDEAVLRYLDRTRSATPGQFSAYWNFPEDIRERDTENGDMINPHELDIRKFAVHFAKSAISLSIFHTPPEPPMTSVGVKRLVSYPQVTFTVGYNPHPEEFPHQLELAPSNAHLDRGLMPPRQALYTAVDALDIIGRPSPDPDRESGIREFSEMFFAIPFKAGLHQTMQLRTTADRPDQNESSEASLASAS